MLQNYPVSGLRLLFLPTLGTARALYLDDKIGSFKPGLEADFVAWNLTGHKEMAIRARSNKAVAPAGDWNRLEFLVFGLAVLGDDRCVKATWIAGKPLYTNPGM